MKRLIFAVLLFGMFAMTASGCFVVYLSSGADNMGDDIKAGGGLYRLTYDGIDNYGDTWEEFKRIHK